MAAGSGVATYGISGSPGVPDDIARRTVSIEYNDLDLLRQTVDGIGADQVAAIILEPVAGNMGLVLPGEGFLQGLRDLCSETGIIFIFDEVMTGFRVALGGAQERFGITPDLSTYSKVIGGGLPVGAFGGRADLMAQLAPSGPVYQAGTLSGNPLAMTAGLATVRHLRDTDPYPQLETLGSRWVKGMRKAADEAGVAATIAHCGSMVGMHLRRGPVTNYTEVQGADTELFQRYFRGMLDAGVYLAPSAFEIGFISTAHTTELTDATIEAASEVLAEIGKQLRPPSD